MFERTLKVLGGEFSVSSSDGGDVHGPRVRRACDGDVHGHASVCLRKCIWDSLLGRPKSIWKDPRQWFSSIDEFFQRLPLKDA